MIAGHSLRRIRPASPADRFRRLPRAVLRAAIGLGAAAAAVGPGAATAAVGPGAATAAATTHRAGWQLTFVSRHGGHASDVTCITAVRCLVLGSRNRVSYAPGDGVTLAPTNGFAAESRNGRVVATTSGLQAQNALACVGQRCVAVGGSPSGMLADELSSGRLTPLPVHGPTAPYGEALDSVACVAVGRCFAVGMTEVQTTRTCSDGANAIYCYADVPVVEELRNRAWSALFPVARSHAAAEPIYRSTVACGNPRLCVAVLPNTSGWLASVWRGGSWLRPVRLPLAHEADAEITSVSCAPHGACMAVGSYARDGHRVPLSLLRLRARWRLVPVPRSGIRLGYFSDVSCPGSAACVAVGSGFSADRRLEPLVERFSAGRWSIEATPRLPPGAGLTAVACPTLDSCEAVGNYGPATGSSWFLEQYR